MPEQTQARELTSDEVLESLKRKFPDQEIMDFEVDDDGERGKFAAGETLYRWFATEQIAIDEATADVRQSLEDQPDVFNQDWLKTHIYIGDTDKRMIADEEADARMDGMGEDEIIEQADKQDEFNAITEKMSALEEKNKEGTPKYQALEKAKDELIEKAREELQEKYYDEIYEELDDPIEYFCHTLGAYSEEDLLKASFIAIDLDDAADDAVSEDGWAHFISHYDGEYDETNEGVVFFIEEEDYQGRERARSERERKEQEEQKEQKSKDWEERWHRRGTITMAKSEFKAGDPIYYQTAEHSIKARIVSLSDDNVKIRILENKLGLRSGDVMEVGKNQIVARDSMRKSVIIDRVVVGDAGLML